MRLCRVFLIILVGLFVKASESQSTVSPRSAAKRPSIPAQKTVDFSGVREAGTFGDRTSDMGRSVQLAFEDLHGACGVVRIPAGTWKWSTPVSKLACQLLEGSGATLLVEPMTTPAITTANTGTPPNNQLDNGGIRHLTLVGPGNADTDVTGSTWTAARQEQVGLAWGSLDGKAADFLENFYDVHIRGFGCGLKIGNAFQNSWFGGSIEGNYKGVCMDGPVGAGENINFHGVQILNNITWGLYQTAGAPEVYCVACSFDYNGQSYRQNGAPAGGQIYLANGFFYFSGHLESRTTPFVVVPPRLQGGINPMISFDNSYFVQVVGGPPVQPSYLQIGGVNTTIFLRNVTTNQQVESGPIPKIPSLVDFTSEGADNNMMIDGMQNFLLGNRAPLPIFKPGGRRPQYYRVPHYSSTNDQDAVSSSGTIVDKLLNSTGLQIAEAEACSMTAGSASATCTATAQLPVPYTDGHYAAVCSVLNTSKPVHVSTISALHEHSFNVTLVSDSTAGSSGGTISCIVTHP